MGWKHSSIFSCDIKGNASNKKHSSIFSCDIKGNASNKKKAINAVEGVEKRETSYTVGGNAN